MSYLTCVREARAVFTTQKRLADGAIRQVSDADLHRSLGGQGNSMAILMQHLSGNMLSRWSDFLTTDGEKPWRHRDQEFARADCARAELLDRWEQGWGCLFEALDSVTSENEDTLIPIRGQSHTIGEAVLRQVSHYGYHVGQLVLLSKHWAGRGWQPLSIPPGESQRFNQDTWGQDSAAPRSTGDEDASERVD